MLIIDKRVWFLLYLFIYALIDKYVADLNDGLLKCSRMKTCSTRIASYIHLHINVSRI